MTVEDDMWLPVEAMQDSLISLAESEKWKDAEWKYSGYFDALCWYYWGWVIPSEANLWAVRNKINDHTTYVTNRKAKINSSKQFIIFMNTFLYVCNPGRTDVISVRPEYYPRHHH